MELYLNTYGTYLHKRGSMFEVKIGDEKKSISAARVSSIVISNAAQITTDAIQLALEYNIDILFLDQYGDPYGRIWFPRMGSSTFIRRRLLEIYANDAGLGYVKQWVGQKLENQAEFLEELLDKRPGVKDSLSGEIAKIGLLHNQLQDVSGSLNANMGRIMGLEGNSARIYFSLISLLLPDKYRYRGRSSRPAKDVFNACLNYGYGILYGKVERALVIAGLDPYIGLLHTDNYNKKSLVYDFIEPYRILVEKPVFYLFSRRKINEAHYDEINQGVTLNDEGKKILVPQLMEYFDKIERYGNKNMKIISRIQADAHKFANQLIGKK
ncbi:MAG: CRISPR-associated endonuclease Cas1 [Candidatus Stygibacter australis]|nr:CRISPR-associated endonuclease Cas1 [Candidatus Stygibacter australis]MDP8321738.1 CRISPR-associated endonuclease Cas1 [Candidatus Stygibacter australis]